MIKNIKKTIVKFVLTLVIILFLIAGICQASQSTEISEQKKEIFGFCGHMNPNIITAESKTSWGIKYYLDYNICELNEYYNWEKLGKYPEPGIFFKITNDFKNISTWCVSVGTFKDNNNPNRIFIVSRKVANELGILEDSLQNIVVRVSVMEEDEWKSLKDCVDLYKLLEIDEMKKRLTNIINFNFYSEFVLLRNNLKLVYKNFLSLL